jgi:hypothetical protein
MNKIKFRKYYLGVTFNDLLDIRRVSLVKLTWEVTGITKKINISNSIKVKLIKILNNVGVICIVIDISQTLELVKSTYSLAFFSILCVVDKSPYAFGNDLFVKKIQHVFSS